MEELPHLQTLPAAHFDTALVAHKVVNQESSIYWEGIYTIILKKICRNDIQDLVNNYYKTNTVPDKMDCSKFVEINKNTKYDYSGNYGKYVDINNTLYQIIDVTPSSECFFSH